MSLLPSTHDNALQKRRGIAKFAPLVNGLQQAMIQLSPSAELGFTIEAEESSYISAESGIAEVLDSQIDQISRTFSLVCNRMTPEIMALFVVGTLTDVAQASGSVTNEVTAYCVPGRSLQLGGAANNGAGVFGISALTAEFYEGVNAAARANSTAYVVGDVYKPATPNDHWYMCTVAGTSDSSPPSFSTSGTTFSDGTATFVDMGLIAIANTSNADFEADLDYAVINLINTGAIADAYSRVPASLRAAGRSFRLNVDYTRSAKTVAQIATGDTVALDGEFWFYTQNTKGQNEVWRCPSATLTPSGDLPLKSGTDYATAPFTVTAKKPATLEAIYINNKPA